MKSKKYIKHRRSKYAFPTKIIKASRGSGGQRKGGVIKGADKALKDIEHTLGRELEVHHTEHRIGEWVFAELKS
jgi:hypothetical protein